MLFVRLGSFDYGHKKVNIPFLGPSLFLNWLVIKLGFIRYHIILSAKCTYVLIFFSPYIMYNCCLNGPINRLSKVISTDNYTFKSGLNYGKWYDLSYWSLVLCKFWGKSDVENWLILWFGVTCSKIYWDSVCHFTYHD